MRFSLNVVAVPFLVLSLSYPSYSEFPSGTVGYLIQLGGTPMQTYVCAFEGVVTCNGKACGGAHVRIEVVGAQNQAASQQVDADENGHYAARLSLQGQPEQMTSWKLSAKAASVEPQTGEAEGRMILTEQRVVSVVRPVELIASSF